MEMDGIVRRILAEVAGYEISLWDIISEISWEHRREYPPPAWLLDKTLAVVGDLLKDGLVEAGNPNGPTFERLPLPEAEIVEFIRREWLALDRYPGTGYVCWFRATPAGKQVAKELGLKGY